MSKIVNREKLRNQLGMRLNEINATLMLPGFKNPKSEDTKRKASKLRKEKKEIEKQLRDNPIKASANTGFTIGDFEMKPIKFNLGNNEIIYRIWIIHKEFKRLDKYQMDIGAKNILDLKSKLKEELKKIKIYD